jgi:hypothetical protein
MMNNIGEELDDDCAMQHQNPGRFLTTKTDIEKFIRNLGKRIMKQQCYLRVIQICALGSFRDYQQSIDAD